METEVSWDIEPHAQKLWELWDIFLSHEERPSNGETKSELWKQIGFQVSFATNHRDFKTLSPCSANFF